MLASMMPGLTASHACIICVAVPPGVMLVLLREVEPGRRSCGGGPARGGARKVDVKRFLATMDPADLVELVWQHASEDADLFRKLWLLMRPLFARTGEDFAGYVRELREINRRKRNFQAELTRDGL